MTFLSTIFFASTICQKLFWKVQFETRHKQDYTTINVMVQKHWHAGEWTSESVQDNKEFFKLVDCQILSQTSKGGKQGNGLVSSRTGKGWQGKLADKEVWREEKISKLWINQSNNSDKKLSHQNHDWDQSTKICWDPYLLLNVNINSCQQIN